MSLRQLAGRFVQDERGLSVTEYGLLLALVAVALITVVKVAGDDIAGWFSKLEGKFVSQASQ